jgi:hypothetical protein
LAGNQNKTGRSQIRSFRSLEKLDEECNAALEGLALSPEQREMVRVVFLEVVCGGFDESVLEALQRHMSRSPANSIQGFKAALKGVIARRLSRLRSAQ